MRQSIEINIDELILEGFPYIDRDKIGNSIRNELAKMISEKGMPNAYLDSQQISTVNGGSFFISKGSTPNSIGKQIAKSIFEGFGNNR
ncbi:MAG: hypothetical protein KDC05_10155 [Bacteroidales bacterium]|nr:hypothetical protein [Bacteroidales bacterium]